MRGAGVSGLEQRVYMGACLGLVSYFGFRVADHLADIVRILDEIAWRYEVRGL
jgi:hypothetical protein